MSFFRFCLYLGAVTAVTAAPKSSNALEPVTDSGDVEKKPAELMSDLMQAMMQLQGQDGGAENSGMKEITQFMGVASDLMHEASKGDLNDPQHVQSMAIKAALALGKTASTAGSGMDSIVTDTLLNPTMISQFMSGDPMTAMTTLVDTMLDKSGTDKSDPLVKLAKSGAKMLVTGEAAPDDNPFAHLHDVVTQGVDPHELAKDNVLMELMLDTIKAAANDETGDPLNAMAEYVLEHPKAAANPIVSGAKAIHKTITDPDEHHKSPLITAAKSIAEMVANQDLHEKSPILNLIKSTIENPTEFAKKSALVNAATQLHANVLNKENPSDHVTDLISTFTKTVASGDFQNLTPEKILAAHPAGEHITNAASVLADSLENAHSTEDEAIKMGRELAHVVTNHDVHTDDPLVKAAQVAHKTVTNLGESNDPLIHHAQKISDHITEGIDALAKHFD